MNDIFQELRTHINIILNNNTLCIVFLDSVSSKNMPVSTKWIHADRITNYWVDLKKIFGFF